MIWSTIIGLFSPQKRLVDTYEETAESEVLSTEPLIEQFKSHEPERPLEQVQETRPYRSEDVACEHIEFKKLEPLITPTSTVVESPPRAPESTVSEIVQAPQAEPLPIISPPPQSVRSEAEQNEAAWAAVRSTSQRSRVAPPLVEAPPEVIHRSVSDARRQIEREAARHDEASVAEDSPISTSELHLPLESSQTNELTAQETSAVNPAHTETSANRFSMLHTPSDRWSEPLPQRNIFVPIATRAEARRIAPVIRTLQSRFVFSGKRNQICICAVGERNESVKEALRLLGIPIDFGVNVPVNKNIDALRIRVLKIFEEILAQVKPEWVVLTGNTLINAMAALAAYHAGVQVARIESEHDPEPDFSDAGDAHRELVDLFSSAHFTETSISKDALVHAGYPPESIFVVGSTAIDSLLQSCVRLGLPLSTPSSRSSGTTRVFISVGECSFSAAHLHEICRAIGNLAVLVPGLYHFIWTSPEEQRSAESIRKTLSDVPGIELLPSCTYEDLLRHISSCDLVLTDSMDIQEEAPSLGKPVIMLGPISDRSEAVRSGIVTPVAPHSTSIQTAVRALARKLSTRHGQIANPYGDGKASARIADFFEGRPVLEFGHAVLPRLSATEPKSRQLPASAS